MWWSLQWSWIQATKLRTWRGVWLVVCLIVFSSSLNFPSAKCLNVSVLHVVYYNYTELVWMQKQKKRLFCIAINQSHNVCIHSVFSTSDMSYLIKISFWNLILKVKGSYFFTVTSTKSKNCKNIIFCLNNTLCFKCLFSIYWIPAQTWVCLVIIVKHYWENIWEFNCPAPSLHHVSAPTHWKL